MKLFNSNAGVVGVEDVLHALRGCGAGDCDVLYVHTGMGFGLPAVGRKALLAKLLEALESLKVKSLVFPTFTFSFCNGETFDVEKTPTPMGAINEYVRKLGNGRRTEDPLLSVYVLGDDAGLVDNLSPYSIGKGSSYDRLHHSGKDVKFLFFGADMRECFTYTHYIEAIVGVPYRYNRKFEGEIISHGEKKPATVWLYSTYGNCRLGSIPVVHNAMERQGMLNKATLGDATICCFKEKDAYDTITQLLKENIYCLTDGTFDERQKNTLYNPAGGRVVSVL